MMDRAVMAAGLGRRVHFVELTVDPNRDTPSRLRAYRKLIGAPANWSLLTGRPAVIGQIWRYFRVWYQRVAEGTPPGADWLTGRALSYDVDHQDTLVYLDARGRERFVVTGNPNATAASIAPALRRFLSGQGRADLSHPDASTWTAAEALSPIAWLTGQAIRLPLTEPLGQARPMGRRRITGPACAKYSVIASVASPGRAASGMVRVASAGGAGPPDRPGISSGP